VIDGIASPTARSFICARFSTMPRSTALYAAADAVLANSGKEPFGWSGSK